MNLLTYNYRKWKSQRNRSVWFSETLAWISTGVGRYFAFYLKLPLKFLNWVWIKNHSMNFFYTWPSIRFIHIWCNSGVSNKLKHFKAANFQRQLRKILRLFSLMLFVVLIIIFFCLESPCYCTFLYMLFVVLIIIFFCLESPCYCTFLYNMNS